MPYTLMRQGYENEGTDTSSMWQALEDCSLSSLNSKRPIEVALHK